MIVWGVYLILEGRMSVGALIGCTNVIARRIAMEMKIDLKIDKIDVLGHLDHRGIDRVADVPVPFPIIELKVNATTSGTEDDMLRLREDLNARCPMSVILKQAGKHLALDFAPEFGHLDSPTVRRRLKQLNDIFGARSA